MKKQSTVTFRTSERSRTTLEKIAKESDIKKSELCRLSLRNFLTKYRNNRNLLFDDYGELLKIDQIEEYEDKRYRRENNLEPPPPEDFDDIF